MWDGFPWLPRRSRLHLQHFSWLQQLPSTCTMANLLPEPLQHILGELVPEATGAVLSATQCSQRVGNEIHSCCLHGLKHFNAVSPLPENETSVLEPTSIRSQGSRVCCLPTTPLTTWSATNPNTSHAVPTRGPFTVGWHLELSCLPLHILFLLMSTGNLPRATLPSHSLQSHV